MLIKKVIRKLGVFFKLEIVQRYVNMYAFCRS